MSIFSIISKIKGVLLKRKQKSELRKKILSEKVSYSSTAENITKSITGSKKLYLQLIKKVHPDLFGKEQQEHVTELASKITKNKRNYNELFKLKIEVENLINIKTN
jgi:hypothetical protein